MSAAAASCGGVVAASAVAVSKIQSRAALSRRRHIRLLWRWRPADRCRSGRQVVCVPARGATTRRSRRRPPGRSPLARRPSATAAVASARRPGPRRWCGRRRRRGGHVGGCYRLISGSGSHPFASKRERGRRPVRARIDSTLSWTSFAICRRDSQRCVICITCRIVLADALLRVERRVASLDQI